MAFQEIFLVVTWNDSDTDITDVRVELNDDRAAQTVIDDDPRVDVWNVKLQTNRNAGSLHKTRVKAGPRNATQEIVEIEANGQVVGEIEQVI